MAGPDLIAHHTVTDVGAVTCAELDDTTWEVARSDAAGVVTGAWTYYDPADAADAFVDACVELDRSACQAEHPSNGERHG